MKVLSLKKNIHLTIFTIAGLSTILRPSLESKITLFRVLLPLLVLLLLLINKKKFIYFFIVSTIFVFYAIVVSYLSRFNTINIPFIFYYVILFFLFFYSMAIFQKYDKTTIFKYFKGLYVCLLVLGFIQYFFGGVYINTQDRLPAVNIFFWNENDYSAVLTLLTCFYFIAEPGKNKYFLLICSAFLILHNDAKLALIALCIFFSIVLLLKIKWNKNLKFGILGFSILGLFAYYFLKDYPIQGSYTLDSIITNLTKRIFTQELFEHRGSFNSRSNAIILGVKHFFQSFGLGIGPGNSILMMLEIVKPGTEDWAAKSMHNFIFQIITEIGFFGITIFLAMFFKIRKIIRSNTIYSKTILKAYFISTIIIVTILSGGAWSNYFFFIIFFFSMEFFNNNKYDYKTL